MVKSNEMDEIVSEMDMFQIPVPKDPYAQTRLLELCQQYWDGDAPEFVSDLMAFLMTTNKGLDMQITQEVLSVYERQKGNTSSFGRANVSLNNSSKKNRSKRLSDVVVKPEVILFDYGANQMEVDSSSQNMESRFTTPKRYPKAISRIKEEWESPQNSSLISSDVFSPAGLTPSRPYSERMNAGKVLAGYGDVDGTDWLASGANADLHVEYYDKNPLTEPYLFMDINPQSIDQAMDDRISNLSELMLAEYCNVTENCKNSEEEMYYVCGQVIHDDNDSLSEQVKSNNLLLRLSTGSSRCVTVDMSHINDCAIFPGQVVCVRGKNNEKNDMVADELFLGLPPRIATFELENNRQSVGVTSVVTAAGPFTTADNMGFEPLVDLLKYVEKHRPSLLILVGPFLPLKHEEISTCAITNSFQALFMEVLQRISLVCGEIGTKFAIVASSKDAAALPCYPTPPMEMDVDVDLENQPMLLADPCLLRVGELVVGVTATDVLFHLGQAETVRCSSNAPSGRMNRLVRHLLLQRTFYPLNPPSLDVNLDYSKMDKVASLPVKPHVLLVPSDLQYFLKNVDDVLAINSGRLAKGSSGGTFCRFEFDSRKLASESGKIINCLRGQVVRI